MSVRHHLSSRTGIQSYPEAASGKDLKMLQQFYFSGRSNIFEPYFASLQLNNIVPSRLTTSKISRRFDVARTTADEMWSHFYFFKNVRPGIKSLGTFYKASPCDSCRSVTTLLANATGTASSCSNSEYSI